MRELLLEIKDIKLNYPNLDVLKGVSFNVYKGDIISIIGKSGSGKTTLLRCLNLLNDFHSGDVIYRGNSLTNKKININLVRQKIGMVFQQFNLFNQKTVLENMLIAPLKVLKINKIKAINKADELLKKVGMDEFKNVRIENLSGGQKQRVAIARALMLNPEILLFDEPTSALDPQMVNEVLNVIKDVCKSGITSIIVSHEMRFVKEISNRVIFMNEGLVYQDSNPDEIFNSNDEIIKEFTTNF